MPSNPQVIVANHLKRTLLIAASLILASQLGCSGKAHLEFAALTFKAVDPPAPRVSNTNLHKCFWWTEDDGRLNVAMEKTGRLLFNDQLSYEIQLALSLEKLPAGRARNYQLARRDLNARVKFGVWEARFVSQTGVVAVYRESRNRLRGSMRLRTSKFASLLLGGWKDPVPYLLLGDFIAVHDEQRGRSIADALAADEPQSRPNESQPAGVEAVPAQPADDLPSSDFQSEQN